MTDGSEPLQNTRHEQYAQLTAAGEVPARAYRAVYGEGSTRKSSEANSTRIRYRDDVSARIVYLRKEALAEHDDDGAELTRAGIGDLMRAVTDALTEAATVCDEAGASAQQSQAIRKLISVHAGRVQRLAPVRHEEPRDTGDLDLGVILSRVPVCVCKANE